MNLVRTAVLAGIVAAGVALAQSGPASGNDNDRSGMATGKPADKMDGGTKTSSPHSKESKPTTGTPGTDTGNKKPTN